MGNTQAADSVQPKNIYRIVLLTLLVLLVPLVAMQFTNEVTWDVTDFIVIGALLIGTGLIYELGIKRINNSRYRIILAVLLVTTLLLTWAELAVGIFGTPFAGS